MPQRWLITAYNPHRYLQCIKGVRALTGLGLREAKELCDDLKNHGQPFVISTELGQREARAVLDECMVMGYVLDDGPMPAQILAQSLQGMDPDLTVRQVLEVLRSAGVS